MCNLVLRDKKDECEVSITELKCERGIRLLRVDIEFSEKIIPKPLTLELNVPAVNIYSVWHPLAGQNRYIAPDWRAQTSLSRLASGAPVLSAISKNGNNVMTVALSDADTSTAISMGVNELSADAIFTVTLFNAPVAPLSKYSVLVRIDTQIRPFYKALSEVEEWWATDCGYTCAYIPDAARLPVDSLWYSFHQSITAEQILRECRASKPLGMETVIIDDGWQTDESTLQYSYCGDWELARSKIPDMKALTDELHRLGMKVVLWFSVPFVGVKSKIYERFSGMYCAPQWLGACCLDPRYKEVRDYLVGVYENAVRDFGLDGLKLDFIDSFKLTEISLADDERRDISCLEDAIDALLAEVTERLRAINPEIMIEFRQTYVGPRIRKYGNMLRVSDCPNDAMRNRIGIIDLRLISGKSAVHSDMLMWNRADSLENISNQLLSVMFGVPQISVKAYEYPEEQMNMLGGYLAFWKLHRKTILDGELIVKNPEDNYSAVYAVGESEIVGVRYSDVKMTVFDGKTNYLFNGGSDTDLPLCFDSARERDYVIYDCSMKEVERGRFGAERYTTVIVPLGGRIEVM